MQEEARKEHMMLFHKSKKKIIVVVISQIWLDHNSYKTNTVLVIFQIKSINIQQGTRTKCKLSVRVLVC